MQLEGRTDSDRTLRRRHDRDPALRFALREAAGRVRGAVLVTHGYAEHSGRYGHVVDAWLARGLAVCTYDLRGHGMSEGERGYVDRFHDYVGDLLELLDALDGEANWRSAGPPVLFGHSLGGLIAFISALDAPQRFCGLALSSPFFDLAMHIPWAKRAAGGVLSRLAPGVALPIGLRGSDVTRDVALAEAYDSDPLVFKKAPSRWFSEVVRAQREAVRRAPALRLPVACVFAGNDRVARAPTTQRLLDAVSSQKRSVLVADDARHEVLNDPGREERIEWLADQITRWRDTQC